MINSPLVDCLGNSVMEEVGEVQFRRAICGDFLQAVWPEEGEVFRNLELTRRPRRRPRKLRLMQSKLFAWPD